MQAPDTTLYSSPGWRAVPHFGPSPPPHPNRPHEYHPPATPAQAIQRLWRDDRWYRKGMTAGWTKLMWLLINVCDKETATVRRHICHIATRADASVRTVQRGLRYLASERFIDYTPGGGRGRAGTIILLYSTWGRPESPQLALELRTPQEAPMRRGERGATGSLVPGEAFPCLAARPRRSGAIRRPSLCILARHLLPLSPCGRKSPPNRAWRG